MSLAQVLPPYPYSDDPLDTLDDVDLSHPNFLAEFPDGKVPIRKAPFQDSWEYPHDPLGYLDFVLRVCHAVEGVDIRACYEAREDFLIAWGYSPTWEITNEQDVKPRIERSEFSNERQRKAIDQMIAAGLTLRQIARYVEVFPEEIVRILVNDAARGMAHWESLLDADEEMRHPDSAATDAIAKKYGLGPSTLIRIRKLIGKPSQSGRVSPAVQRRLHELLPEYRKGKQQFHIRELHERLVEEFPLQTFSYWWVAKRTADVHRLAAA